MKSATKLFLLTALLLPGLIACQPTEMLPELPSVTLPPSNVADSSRNYVLVVDGIRTALEEEFPDITWRAAGPAQLGAQSDGGCTLFLRDYISEGNIVRASDRFRKVMDAINPVLERNGFSAVSGLDKGPDGWWSVTSGNGQGARMFIAGRTSVKLSLYVPVAVAPESCSDEELTGPASS